MTRYPYRTITNCDVLLEQDMGLWCSSMCEQEWDSRYYAWRQTYWLFESESDWLLFCMIWSDYVHNPS